MEQQESICKLSPAALRALIRHGGPKIQSTTGLAAGYLQANVLILPSSMANDFEEFCRRNPAPLPLLYRSQPGESSCPPLAAQADVRTDISQYCVFEKGHLTGRVSSLLAYDAPEGAAGSELQAAGRLGGVWSDMVCFYLGCSFSFENSLQRAGVPVRNVEQRRNVSMYRTTAPCVRAGVFQCPLVVTMRPIPAHLLDLAVQSTYLTPSAHGAPIHIGDPALLGIPDLSRPDYGESVEAEPGDVSVFWACGVTCLEAVLSSKPPLAFTHAPGCMFVTDLPDPSTQTADHLPLTSEPDLSPLSFLISQSPLHYSLVSRDAVRRIRRLETIIGEDPGERGIKALFVQDELLRSCLSLSHSSSVVVTTGFPTHHTQSPPDETDGPPGAIAMVTMLQALGKEVTILTDHRALEMNQAIMEEAVSKGVMKAAVPLVTFKNTGPDSALQFLCHHGDATKPRFDHLVAIERSGRAADGAYYNMRGINIKHLVDPIDDLFTMAEKIPGINTTGVGDGGNELGMGKVKDKVRDHMPNGRLVACDVAADYAITAGVSNWGGYAVACGLYLLKICPSHQRYVCKGLGLKPTISVSKKQELAASLPSVNKEEELLSILVRFGIRSGKTGNLGMEVDGLTFHPTHSDLIRRLLDCTLNSDAEH
ncbi:D-glutamate cyclase, mitochondrial [Aplochiton taeniatus]